MIVTSCTQAGVQTSVRPSDPWAKNDDRRHSRSLSFPKIPSTRSGDLKQNIICQSIFSKNAHGHDTVVDRLADGTSNKP